MKKIASLFLLFCLGTSQISFSAEPNTLRSDAWVGYVRKEYVEGKYAEFLKNNKEQFIQEKGSASSPATRIELSEDEIAKGREAMKPIYARLKSLKIERDEALLSIASKDPALPISEIIRSACSPSKTSYEQNVAVNTLHEMPFVNFPAFRSPFAEKIREILFEYNLRDHLAIRHFFMDENPDDDAIEQWRVALQLEKFNALFAVQGLQGESDEKLSHMIQTAYDAFLLSAPRDHDEDYLTSLEKNRRQPANDLEREVVEVMKSYAKQLKEVFSSLHHLGI